MSFFGRAANLVKGGIKSIGRSAPEDELKRAALEAELDRLERPAVAQPAAPPRSQPTAPARSQPKPGERGPPERDASGGVKRTL